MTINEVKDLSEDELRIKVAELCGWRQKTKEPQRGTDGSLPWWSPDESWIAWDVDSLPDYPRDLNASHEMEKLLDDGLLWHGYLNRLWDVVCPQFEQMSGLNAAVGLLLVHATARQRAEAFVLTMQEDKT